LIEGNVRLHARFGTSNPPVELLATTEVAAQFRGRSIRPLIDLNTMRTINISWEASPRYHTDWTPATPADTAVVQNILRPNWALNDPRWNNPDEWRNAGAWNARPGVMRLGMRLIAVGFHLFPHHLIMGGASPGLPLRNGNTNGSPWDVGGHMCMYYGDSPGSASMLHLNDTARQAQTLGQNRVFTGQLH
jgi:hypothetical protein